MNTRKPNNQRLLWHTLLGLWCLFSVARGQDYYDNYPDYQDYAGEQGYDDHLYHDYAARQQDKVVGGGGYV